jgi:hypothetical protein
MEQPARVVVLTPDPGFCVSRVFCGAVISLTEICTADFVNIASAIAGEQELLEMFLEHDVPDARRRFGAPSGSRCRFHQAGLALAAFLAARGRGLANELVGD